MIKPTGQLGITGTSPGTKTKAATHKTFALEPHSAFQANISANYHGKTIDQLNPSKARENAVRFPQTGLGG
jgi:hypothetical protein